MALKKRTYISKETIITAQNLNDIQDAIIALEGKEFPTALKNPNALTINLGSTSIVYDGSSAETVTIEDGTNISY